MKKRLLSVMLMFVMTLAMLPMTALASNTSGEYTDKNDWLLSNARYNQEEDCFVLTEDYTSWDTGSIWYNHPCYGDFVLEMDYYTGSTNRKLSGADGIAVAFYANYSYNMVGGEEMGFNGSKGYGVELDTFCNSRRGDPNYNHIALIKESVGNHLATERLPESEDEQWHHLKIVVEDGTCSAYVDSTLKLSHEVDSTGYGWIGITAATGDGENLHAVKNIIVKDNSNQTVENYLDVNLSNAMVSDSDGQYKYKITADIENSGGATAENVTVTLDLAEQLHLSDSMSFSYKLGDIANKESKQVTWIIEANWPESSTAVIYGVTVNIDDVASLRQEDYIYLRAKNQHSNEFVFGVDQWSFSNTQPFFDPNGNELYYLDDIDYVALKKELSNLEKDIVYQKKNMNWGGSCYGMSDIAILTKIGVIDANDIQEGKSTLYSVVKSNNDSVESLINFYFLQQFLVVAQNNMNYFAQENTIAQLQEIEEMTETVPLGGVPVLLCFSGESGGHAVVAYGVEHGEFTLNDGFLGTTLFGTKYDSRIIIYDCNCPNGSIFSYLWYNTGTDEWCIPNYPWANKLVMACNDIEILDCVNHKTAVENYSAWLEFKGKAAGYFFEKAGLFQLIDSSTDMKEDGLVTYYAPNITADGTGDAGTLMLTLPSLTDNYSVKPLEGEASEFTLYYEDSALSVATDEAEQIDFNPNGKVEATGVSGQYTMSLVFNEGHYSLPWYKTSISGTDCTDISMEQTRDGIVIAGSDLNDVTVVVENDDELKTIQFSTGEESVLLTDKETSSGAEPAIMLDLDNDGIYEENIDSYTITVNAIPVEGGTVDGGGIYDEGTSVSVTAAPASGYRFVHWTENGYVVSTSTTYTFDVEADRILTAEFEQISSAWSGSYISTPSTYHFVTVSFTENGAVKVNPTDATQGQKVTIYITPDQGYITDSVIVIDEKGNNITVTHNGDGTYSFIMPDGPVTVAVTFKEDKCDGGERCPSKVFSDVDQTKWFHESLDYVITNGFMAGVGGGCFAPNGVVSRAQMVTVLWNMRGNPVVNYAMTYSDISESDWYAEAIRWATNEGIVGGYGNGKFGPNDLITREQMAVMLYRYEKKYGSGGFAGDWMFRLTFTDIDKISDWAYEAVAWCNMKDIILGKDSGIFDPSGLAKRCEMAAILMRYDKKPQSKL